MNAKFETRVDACGATAKVTPWVFAAVFVIGAGALSLWVGAFLVYAAWWNATDQLNPLGSLLCVALAIVAPAVALEVRRRARRAGTHGPPLVLLTWASLLGVSMVIGVGLSFVSVATTGI